MAIAFEDEPAQRMTRADYRAWIDAQPGGRFERIDGIVVAMAPEQVGHAIIKARVWQALDRALRKSGIDACQALPDGITVETGDSDYKPDVLVHCGPLEWTALVSDRPVIVVEVVSPSSRAIDRTTKMTAYFRLPTVQHYLIVWPDRKQLVHHRRVGLSEIGTRMIVAGEIDLTPPGISIIVEEIYG